MVKSSIHQTYDMQQQKAKKGGVICNSLRNNYSQPISIGGPEPFQQDILESFLEFISW